MTNLETITRTARKLASAYMDDFLAADNDGMDALMNAARARDLHKDAEAHCLRQLEPGTTDRGTYGHLFDDGESVAFVGKDRAYCGPSWVHWFSAELGGWGRTSFGDLFKEK
ncbi:hypothetical protein [Brevibacterium moorei]|uniref:hypothetical protein n=1 Tax=Brevibacterium moorei TaxID=2968457 RepID=UPI00211CE93B|nr:hypothetical protein [Brevibacterium sp. 68QC2CO]MCQ9384431.1 hypothetical protein [Brevibacterium sp. 68QC2CO]